MAWLVCLKPCAFLEGDLELGEKLDHLLTEIGLLSLFLVFLKLWLVGQTQIGYGMPDDIMLCLSHLFHLLFLLCPALSMALSKFSAELDLLDLDQEY